MTQLSNLNSTIRGEPPAGLTAGTAIATVTTNALEFLNSFSKSQNRCLERAMGKAFRVWRKFAQQGHSVIVEGKNGMAMSKPVTGADVNGIAGVKIQVSNPLMQTLGGRSDLADKLMQNGLVTNLKGYFRIIDGAPPSEIYGTELSEADLESAENDAMMEGKPVIALSIDDHPSHIRTHSSLLNDPDIRMSNERVAPILQHIMEHAQLAQATDPMLMAMVRTGKMPQLPPPVEPPAPGKNGSKPAKPEGPRNEPANVAEPTQDPLGRNGGDQGQMQNISPEMVGA
jgi:DNA-binding protein Fis